MGELLPLVTIVLLSLTLGASLKALGTGMFVAGIVGEYLPVVLIIPLLFIAGGIMSFTTGTSWGTFAILIPIGVPLIQTLGLPPIAGYCRYPWRWYLWRSLLTDI